jgi:transcriptional regulator with AAA-type ATPase domain
VVVATVTCLLERNFVQETEGGTSGKLSLRSSIPVVGPYGMITLATPNISINGTHFIVASEVMRKFMGMLERVARHVGTVLIIGETGTGKELLAHAVHQHSLRCSKPLVEINCAALPENLVESELFGYEKGAFSGADAAKPGLFELANMGTIFLDEIGELDLKIQVKLLRILDRAPYYRLGGHRKITSDVRVVAATNRNLKEEVKAGQFRKDLYHRLSQFELCVPPLRERHQDIAALAEYFLGQQDCDLKFSQEALRLLESYSWPGNVRELQNVVNKIAVMASGPDIGPSEVQHELKNAQEDDSDPVAGSNPVVQPGTPAHAIKKALENTGGHRGKAAEQLGISRRTLSRKLREYGLSSAREAAPSAQGTLSHEQQRYFRAPVRIPVSLQTADGSELTCTAVNLSGGGLGLEGVTEALDQNHELLVRFRLPDSEMTISAPARLAWTGSDGRVGITFTDANSAAHQAVRRWLRQKMAEEGWGVQSEEHTPSKTAGVKSHAASAGE